MNQTVALPWATPPLTQNQLRRTHHMIEARLKKVAITEATACIMRAELEPMHAANVVLHYQPGTRRRFDADGLAPTLKVSLDALVHCGILRDDSLVEVPFVGIRIHPPVPGVQPGMWLTLEAIA